MGQTFWSEILQIGIFKDVHDEMGMLNMPILVENVMFVIKWMLFLLQNGMLMVKFASNGKFDTFTTQKLQRKITKQTYHVSKKDAH